MKKAILLLSLVLLTKVIFLQDRDTRAEVDFNGRISELSLSPDGKIWITTNQGQIFYTNHIDSNWHSISAFSEGKKDEYGYSFDAADIDRLSFFSKDTAMATGYIRSDSSEKYGPEDGYYLTFDGGKTWQIRRFGENEWIYDACVIKGGHAWMGGSDGSIYYSNNYGMDFKKLKSPYNQSSRMHTIHMINQTTGISGALHNYIYQTEDNWKSCKKIKTPLDQKIYASDNGRRHSDDRINKIRLWNDYIIVNQNGRIFYTEKDDIEWRKFPDNLQMFCLDIEINVLYAITSNNELVKFSEPTSFESIGTLENNEYPKDLKVMNGNIYILLSDNSVLQFNGSGKKKNVPYTTEIPIPTPDIVVKGKDLWWGTSYKDHLYISDDQGETWFREKKLDFNSRKLKLLNDSNLIIWTGERDSYLYELSKHDYSLYLPKNPFGDFFDYHIEQFELASISSGCFHHVRHILTYKWDGDSSLTKEAEPEIVDPDEDEIEAVWRNSGGSDFKEYSGKISERKLRNLLHKIDQNPRYLSNIEEFNITKDDIELYKQQLKERIKNHDSEWDGKFDEELYSSIPDKLKEIDSTTFDMAVNAPEGIHSTSSRHFYVQIINTNNDTILFQNHYFHNNFAWNLPWTVKYKNEYFRCYNLDFSKFVKDAMPEEFMGYEVFSNAKLLMDLGNFYAKKSRELED